MSSAFSRWLAARPLPLLRRPLPSRPARPAYRRSTRPGLSALPTPPCWKAGASAGPSCRFSRRLRTSRPISGADLVYLPGGYPELWADQIECAGDVHCRSPPGRGRQANLRRMRRQYGSCRSAHRPQRSQPPDGRAAAAADELCRTAPASRLPLRDPARRYSAGNGRHSFPGHEFHYAEGRIRGASRTGSRPSGTLKEGISSTPACGRARSSAPSFI